MLSDWTATCDNRGRSAPKLRAARPDHVVGLSFSFPKGGDGGGIGGACEAEPKPIESRGGRITPYFATNPSSPVSRASSPRTESSSRRDTAVEACNTRHGQRHPRDHNGGCHQRHLRAHADHHPQGDDTRVFRGRRFLCKVSLRQRPCQPRWPLRS